MAAITNYSTLKTAIADWMNRTDLDASIPQFIQATEAAMNAVVAMRSMETRATLSTVAGNAYVTLPEDMVDARRMVLQSVPNVAMKYVTPDELTRRFPNAQQGAPLVWTVIGQEAQFAPIPDAVYPIELTYLRRIPALSDTNASNWVLSIAPHAYLFGALAEASLYVRDYKAEQSFRQQFRSAMQELNAIDWFSGSTMSVRSA